ARHPMRHPRRPHRGAETSPRPGDHARRPRDHRIPRRVHLRPYSRDAGFAPRQRGESPRGLRTRRRL
ncbi:MAG: hypothetical protein AVDCRST_MAG78-3697, partial [uncultured Rubrobacteraceae bacterium]